MLLITWVFGSIRVLCGIGGWVNDSSLGANVLVGR